MLYLLPSALLSGISIVVLLSSATHFATPGDHYLRHPGELAILASNLSASFTVTTFWLLFIFSIKSWSVPSFFALQGGIIAAYGLYALLVSKEVQHKTFLNFVFGESPPVAIRWLFFGLAFATIVVELGLGRAFLETILKETHKPQWIAAFSIVLLAAATILYTYSGGMYAVLMIDFIFITVCLVVIAFSVKFASGFALEGGFVSDYRSYKFENLTFLDYCFYASAGLYVTLMFLFHPDYWYRNLRLPYKSKIRRVATIVSSAIATSLLLQVAYYIAVYSRTSQDINLLYNNLLGKEYHFNDVVSVVLPSFQRLPGGLILMLMIQVSAFTTVNALIITSLAGFYETGEETGSTVYQQTLYDFFKLTIFLAIVGLVVDVSVGTFIGVMLGSGQLTLTASLVTGRLLNLPRSLYSYAIGISVVVFGISAGLNFALKWHWYYPFLAILSAAFSGILVWGIRAIGGSNGD